ncbi:hypothetical protein SNEBB_002417 [Seison nebaliae]|nr:hypothetical protein SNEBB_002417 [Seison nebaliae]
MLSRHYDEKRCCTFLRENTMKEYDKLEYEIFRDNCLYSASIHFQRPNSKWLKGKLNICNAILIIYNENEPKKKPFQLPIESIDHYLLFYESQLIKVVLKTIDYFQMKFINISNLDEFVQFLSRQISFYKIYKKHVCSFAPNFSLPLEHSIRIDKEEELKELNKKTEKLMKWKLFDNNNSLINSYERKICISDKLTENHIRHGMKCFELFRFPLITYICQRRQTLLFRSAQFAQNEKFTSPFSVSISSSSSSTIQSDMNLKSIMKYYCPTNTGLIICLDQQMTIPKYSVGYWKFLQNSTRFDLSLIQLDTNRIISSFSDMMNSLLNRTNESIIKETIKPTEEVNDSDELKPSKNQWLSLCGKWLVNVRNAIRSSMIISSLLLFGSMNLKESNDTYHLLLQDMTGVDLTCVISSLVKILQEKKYRTYDGFIQLILLDWFNVGHPFANRSSTIFQFTNNNNNNNNNNMSNNNNLNNNLNSKICLKTMESPAPIFLLFLDSVYQLIQQFPTTFQFNTDFLVILATNSYSSSFGTFLQNYPNERELIEKNTISLWSWMCHSAIRNKLTNKFYFENDELILTPNMEPKTFKFWWSFYGRFVFLPANVQREKRKLLNGALERTVRLNVEAEELRKKLTMIKM